jgi:ferredoxin
VLAVPEWYSQLDVVISLPKLKTHCLTTMTCGLKNVYGMVSGHAKAQFHTKYPSPQAMSAFLVKVFGVFKPVLTIADAVTAMEGNGPAHGQPLPVGVLVGSRDAVALDAVGCNALQISPSSVPMIRYAAAAGLGSMAESEIDCRGSGVSRLRAVRLKPSLARFLQYLPEWMYGTRIRPLRMRPRIRNSSCVKCGMCSSVCPRKTISIDARTGFPVIKHANCIDCFCCLESCPKGAIAMQLWLGKFLRLATQMPRKGAVK